LKVKLICAISSDGYIARHSNEKIQWSKDLSLFKKQTMNKTVIIGFNTHKTLVNELDGRNLIIPTRTDKANKLIKNISKTEPECFIAGGGNTNSKFANYLTDIYLTPHPIFLGSGIRLFSTNTINAKTKLENKIPVPGADGIFQYHFKVLK